MNSIQFYAVLSALNRNNSTIYVYGAINNVLTVLTALTVLIALIGFTVLPVLHWSSDSTDSTLLTILTVLTIQTVLHTIVHIQLWQMYIIECTLSPESIILIVLTIQKTLEYCTTSHNSLSYPNVYQGTNKR